MTAVGDPFQAIYGWRGAAASNITTFAEDFRTCGRTSGRTVTRSRSTGAAGQQSWTWPTCSAARCGRCRFRDRLLDCVRHSGRLVVRAIRPDGLGLLQAPTGTPPGQVRAATFDTWPEEVSWIARPDRGCAHAAR